MWMFGKAFPIIVQMDKFWSPTEILKHTLAHIQHLRLSLDIMKQLMSQLFYFLISY